MPHWRCVGPSLEPASSGLRIARGLRRGLRARRRNAPALRRAVALEIELARSHGGEQTRVIEQSPVRHIDLEGEKPVVMTDSAEIVADRVIVAAGGWVKRLLAVTRGSSCGRPASKFSTSVPPTRSRFGIGRFPVFIFKGAGADDAFYGMPEFQDLGVKVARHGGPDCEPDRRGPDHQRRIHNRRQTLPARPYSGPCRRPDRSHRGLPVHRRARRAISGRFSAGTARRDRRQPVQRPRLQILVSGRPRPGRPGRDGSTELAIDAWRIRLGTP